ncbi:phosphonate metabolism protein/1,5-bisphosphokinase (PRPP-forming) PhnN [Noviherbaspirillum sp. Root189]|uniref:phosphonate metabolism protein/1,5-bisphosphokinase (PRPP-forming) PhnN n=1 Tax=Noviherbaspirillum sp. Root189 TaxID=1736487 RepID=UPI00070A74DA|nr:phosphonate metabolism protein/1,5-bisphosphokinase (PRPP-forming) PhnN [Noviherbaspirillum sp. Root189]KRB93135.1 hypothetical protein ASE07_14305 [Noviherbaspirillum sp. Root189]
MTRYAIYYTAAPDSALWNAGSRWLGRDAANGHRLEQPAIPGVPAPVFQGLTGDPCRYGFHATLKAPFRLQDGFDESHLYAMAKAFAATQTPITLSGLQVRPINGFLALRPSGLRDDIAALAMRSVAYFDPLRAPLSESELSRRRHAGLSERQDALLQRWGYPYTEEEYRFHMTLTTSLRDIDEEAAYAIRKAAEGWFDQALSTVPCAIDAISIFREEVPNAPFLFLKRFPFEKQDGETMLPKPGRLFFIVGPSGVGKDSLIRWVKEKIADDGHVVFTRRSITRAAHDSEDYESLSVEEYWRLAAGGHFAMNWQANGLHYGVRRGIEADLIAGRDVVVNGSRQYIPELCKRFPDAQVVWIDADAEAIRQRMLGRRRESGAALLYRMKRAIEFSHPDIDNLIRLDNSGPLELAGARLMEILTR